MSYFGGTGSGQGWRIIKVLPDVALLQQLLNFPAVRLYYGQQEVSVLSPFRAQEEVLESHERLLEAWKRGTPTRNSLEWETSCSLVCRDNSITIKACRDSMHVTMRSNVPCINFLSGYVGLDSKGRLCTNFGDGFWMGYHISYPRVFSTKWSDWENVETSGLSESKVFDEMERRVKAMTVPLVLETPTKSARTPIRISPSMFEMAAMALQHCDEGISLSSKVRGVRTS